MDPTLAEGNYDTAIVHVGINGIINNACLTKVENLVLNLEKIEIKLKKSGIKNVCLSGLVFTTSVYLPLLNQVNKCILDICKAQNISFINNDNIIRNDMYRDRLHLLCSGKFFLSNNFIENINIFLEMHTPSACPHTHTTSLYHSCFSDLEAFCKCKLQYPKNQAIGYLNINSLRKKIVDLGEIMSSISLDYFVVSETKLDSSFPSAQFNTGGNTEIFGGQR